MSSARSPSDTWMGAATLHTIHSIGTMHYDDFSPTTDPFLTDEYLGDLMLDADFGDDTFYAFENLNAYDDEDYEGDDYYDEDEYVEEDEYEDFDDFYGDDLEDY